MIAFRYETKSSGTVWLAIQPTSPEYATLLPYATRDGFGFHDLTWASLRLQFRRQISQNLARLTSKTVRIRFGRFAVRSCPSALDISIPLPARFQEPVSPSAVVRLLADVKIALDSIGVQPLDTITN